MADGGESAEIVVLSSDSEEKRLKSEPHANGTSLDDATVKSEPTGGDGGVKVASKLSLKRKREISGTSNNGENSSEDPTSVCAPNSDVLSSSTDPVVKVNSSSSSEVQTKTVVDTALAEASKKSFSQFVHLCSTLTKDKDVLKFLQKRFNAADPMYLSSQAFLDFLTKRTEKLKESGKKEVFVHMKAVIDELKANKKSESGSEKSKRKNRGKGDQSGQDSSTEFSDTSEGSSAKRFKPDQASLDETRSKDEKADQNGHGSEKNGPGKSEEDTDVDKSAAHPEESIVFDGDKTSAEDNPNNSSGEKDTEMGQGVQASSSNEDPAESDRKAKKRQKQIRRLEKLLAIVSKEIKRLEAKEVSLDDLDDEDSTYIQEDRLKKRFNTIWNKLCELKGEEMITGREVERTIKFKGTRFPEINRRIMKFLRRNDAFPDFHDILAIVQKTNRKENLRLPPRHVHDLAKEAFTEIGDKFQRRRQRDLVQNFGSYLTDSFDPKEDPAKEDAELQQKLRDNKMHGKRRLDEVLEKYTRKQYEMHLDGETAQGSDTEDPPVRGEADVETEEDLDEDEMEDEEQLENSQVIEKVLEKADDSEEEESMREITVVKPRKARKRFLPAFPDSDEGVEEDGPVKMAGIEGGSPVTFHHGSCSGDLLGETSGIGKIEKEEEEEKATTTDEPLQLGVTEDTTTKELIEMNQTEESSTDAVAETEESVHIVENDSTETVDFTTNDHTERRGSGDITTTTTTTMLTDTIEILSSAESDVTDDSADWNNDKNEAACRNGRTPDRHPLSRFSIDSSLENGSSQDSDCIAIETVDLEHGLCSSQNVDSPENNRSSAELASHSKTPAQRVTVDPLRLQDLRIKVSSILSGGKSRLGSSIRSEPAESSSSYTRRALDSPSQVSDSSLAALSQDTVSSTTSGLPAESVERPNSPDIIVLSDSD
ncbi:uncharacterized protein LOC118421501 isoform X1 [Branchiostoma floridae]|uniref:Death domain-associated protein 6 n=1 Tax=Branchiostoma floridae TaxID=7739 RepID=A0A9J7MZV2_BRAFL|nr:uncharacterized protein LOC118421501 isoform X1 [Branchiostoma floridae]